MQKTKIEWLRDPTTGKQGFSINPVKGLCPMDCKDNQGKSYCYARRMYKRFKWNPEIRYDDTDGNIPVGSKVFVGSTIDLFHKKTIQYLPRIMERIDASPGITFIFLTKNPQNLPREWPENCWVGVSWTGSDTTTPLRHFRGVKAAVKFISFEPLLEFPAWWTSDLLSQSYQKAGISWIIIGALTPVKASTRPRIEWIKELVEAADKANCKVFEKNNLISILGENLRQEYPAALEQTGGGDDY